MTSIIKVDQIQNAAGTAGLTIDSDGVVSKSVLPAWRVGLTADTVITSLDATKIEFDQTSSSDNMFLSGSCTLSGGLITVPKAGIYQVNANIRVDDVGSGYIIGQIRINNDSTGNTDTYSILGSPATNFETVTLNDIFSLEANDTVGIWLDTNGDSNYHAATTSSFSGAMIG